MSLSTRSKWTLFGVTVALLVLTTVSGAVLGVTEAAGESEPAGAASIAAVSQFAGAEPERCVFAAPGLQLCSWPLEGHLFGANEAGDEALALNLICEVDTEAASDSDPTCEVHPVGPLTALPAVSAGNPNRIPAKIPAGVADAATVTELSRVLGEIPAQCRTGAGMQRCDWKLRSDDTATLRCELPLDGSPRRAGSCQVIQLEIAAS